MKSTTVWTCRNQWSVASRHSTMIQKDVHVQDHICVLWFLLTPLKAYKPDHPAWVLYLFHPFPICSSFPKTKENTRKYLVAIYNAIIYFIHRLWSPEGVECSCHFVRFLGVGPVITPTSIQGYSGDMSVQTVQRHRDLTL